MSKKSPISSLMAEEKARKQWDGNEAFIKFVEKNREETYNALVGDKGGEDDWQNALVPGLMSMVHYTATDEEFDMVLALFVESLVARAKKQVNPKHKRNELWKIMFTLTIARDIESIEQKDKMYDFLENRVVYTLYMYLWRDYSKQINKEENTDNAG